jgi:hypothetical protein
VQAKRELLLHLCKCPAQVLREIDFCEGSLCGKCHGKTGGHVLDFSIANGTDTELDLTSGFSMTLPPTKGSFTEVNLSQDLSGALAKVEK